MNQKQPLVAPTLYDVELPPIDRAEAFRYTGTAKPTAAESELMEACVAEAEAEGVIVPRVVYAVFPAVEDETGWDIGFCHTASKSLAVRFVWCNRVLVFAATIGVGIDRLIAKYEKVSPAKALLFGAIGTERVEEVCNRFCNAMREQGYPMNGRFSPGFGDLTLEMQQELFRLLDCPRRIGVSLTESLLMTPTKSVTALCGVYPTD